MNDTDKEILKREFPLGQKALEALTEAFADLVREERKRGGCLVVWENGQVVHKLASEITLPGE